jgi:hypothetical protein
LDVITTITPENVVHTEANDFLRTMPIQNHWFMNQTLWSAKLDTKEIHAY